jgi:hypothetical protein
MTEWDVRRYRFILVKGRSLEIGLFGNEVIARPGNCKHNI